MVPTENWITRVESLESVSWWVSFVFLIIVFMSLITWWVIIMFLQFSHSVVSDSLRSHGPQHARPPCPSPTPGIYSNSCPLSRWCHPTMSSSVVHFSFCLQSFPASGSFQMNQFFVSGGQSIRVSASASVLPMNIQNWFPLEWTGWISLQSKGLLRFISNTTVQKHQFFGPQLFNLLYRLVPTSPFKGNQSWVFFGRNDAKAETPVLWLPHRTVDSL